MTKTLRSILLALLLCILVFLFTILGQGYLRYQREIERLPIAQAVEAYTEKDGFVAFSELDDDFVQAVIAVEDKRFFERKGYDFVALCRAMYHNLKAKKVIEGGSTITEQIAKNLYLNGYVDGIEAKTAEIFIMLDLEKNFPKDELLALYVNMNYYGDGYWGIRNAAKGYYDTTPDDLSLAQAAILAGIPNAPAVYQLSTGFELARNRQAWVLQTMLRNGFISQEDMDQALLEDVRPS